MKTKYIIIEYSYPIIFSECNKHSDFKHLGEITSAGFCNVNLYEDEMDVYGESVSLGIKSDPDNDAPILNKLIFS